MNTDPAQDTSSVAALDLCLADLGAVVRRTRAGTLTETDFDTLMTRTRARLKHLRHLTLMEETGLVNRAELFRLLRYEIEDARWKAAMQAIKDSIRVEGTKEHVRFYRREDARSKWVAVTIDVADA